MGHVFDIDIVTTRFLPQKFLELPRPLVCVAVRSSCHRSPNNCDFHIFPIGNLLCHKMMPVRVCVEAMRPSLVDRLLGERELPPSLLEAFPRACQELAQGRNFVTLRRAALFAQCHGLFFAWISFSARGVHILRRRRGLLLGLLLVFDLLRSIMLLAPYPVRSGRTSAAYW